MAVVDGWLATLIVFMALQTLAGCARFYVKARILKELPRAEDWALMFSYVLSIAFDVIMFVAYTMYNGKVASLWRIAWLSYVIELLYPIATLAVKVALCRMLARIFAGTFQSKVIIVSMAVYTFVALGYFFLIMFNCGNPTRWLYNLARDQCKGSRATFPVTYLHSAATILIDILFVVLPCSYIRKANMDKRTKISVCGILALGSLVVFSIARVPLLSQVTGYEDKGSVKGTQSTTVMSAIEIAIGVICFCLTACKPLFKSFFRVVPAYTPRGSSPNLPQNRFKVLPPQPDDLEKSAYAKEAGITSTPSEDDEAESSSSPSESGATTQAGPAIVMKKNRDDAIVHNNPSQTQPKTQWDSDNVSMSDDRQRRESRIRSWDMRFYGIFSRADKPPPVITETNAMSPVSTRDMRFYGIDNMELTPEVASNTSHEAAVRSGQQDEVAHIPVIATKPTSPSTRTRDMSVDANGMLIPGPLSHHPVENGE